MLLAWQAVQLVWTLLGARPAPAAVSGGPADAPAAQQGPTLDVDGIVNAHLFGIAGASGSEETDPTRVAATQMNLVLVGTIAHADPQQGFAIVGESATTARVYAVGKTITGGTKLHSVYPDRVILDRGGKLEALLLPKKFTGGGVRGRGAAAAGEPDARPAVAGTRRTESGGDHGDHPPAAGVCEWPAARLPGLSRAATGSSSPSSG